MKQCGLKVSFYLKKSEMSDDGLCPVMGRINVGRYSEAAFSAKLSASPKAFQNVHRELRKACRCEPGSWHTEIIQLHLQMPGNISGNGV